MKNTFGSAIALTLFGESHGNAIGVVIDGLAAGIPIDGNTISSPEACATVLQQALNKRAKQ